MRGRASRSFNTAESGCCASTRSAPDSVTGLACREKPRRTHSRGGGEVPFSSPHTHPSKPMIWFKISVGPFARDLPEAHLADRRVQETACRVRGVCLAAVTRSMLPGGRSGLQNLKTPIARYPSRMLLPKKDCFVSKMKTGRSSLRYTKAAIRVSKVLSYELEPIRHQTAGMHRGAHQSQSPSVPPRCVRLGSRKPGQMRECQGRKQNQAAASPPRPSPRCVVIVAEAAGGQDERLHSTRGNAATR